MMRHFHTELNDLKINLLKMASLVERALRDSLKAFNERDEALAKRIIEGDERINGLEVGIDKQCLSLLARYQPMAGDLRFITATMRINFDLERCGDQAVNVAERVIELVKRPPLFCCMNELQSIAEIAIEMLIEAVNAFVYRDDKLAIEVCKRDDEVDELRDYIFKALLDFMVTHSPAVRRGTHLIIVTRSWERVADHATNIAEHVVFLLEGKIIRHQY